MLLCYPIQDRQGTVTSWGCFCVPGLLPPFGSWRPGAVLQRGQAHWPGRKSCRSWNTAQGSPGPAGSCLGLWHRPPHWGRGTDQGQNCIGLSSLGLPTCLTELWQSLALGTGAWGSQGRPTHFLQWWKPMQGTAIDQGQSCLGLSFLGVSFLRLSILRLPNQVKEPWQLLAPGRTAQGLPGTPGRSLGRWHRPPVQRIAGDLQQSCLGLSFLGLSFLGLPEHQV